MAAGAQGAGLIYNRALSAVSIGGNVGEGLHRVEVQLAGLEGGAGFMGRGAQRRRRGALRWRRGWLYLWR